jgi:hypothetical protein
MCRLSGLGIRTSSAILVRTAGCNSIEVDFNSTPRLKVLNVRSESVNLFSVSSLNQVVRKDKLHETVDGERHHAGLDLVDPIPQPSLELVELLLSSAVGHERLSWQPSYVVMERLIGGGGQCLALEVVEAGDE